MLEAALRAALLDWLRTDPMLTARIGTFREEATGPITRPMLAIAASASRDWSTKTESGREVRIAIEHRSRGDAPDGDLEILAAIEARVLALPREHDTFTLVTSQFLRARNEKRSHNLRSSLLEFRFLVLAG
ncbi:tail completion protein gp17 [Pseudoblastomonas halimionae]|uniref:DUF3168 domain-containing protein n=1 Tax=Alteriqipengyuania halimionae TaxID=1926630 RepID=A0A6I4U936_9SPHN|nr:DUF3168 domain-containing protein [Alteriqipengyuania halimionae]MXP11022.1 DUF3168 domain-containing protein [Alteriqipengyuania halimionae]